MNDDIQERIKLACIEAFNEHGCKLNLDDISQKLHISKKTIYRHFASKEEILEQIMTETFDDVHAK